MNLDEALNQLEPLGNARMRAQNTRNGAGDNPFGVRLGENFCLGEIGIRFPEHRTRAMAIGEKLGLYRDYPGLYGCTSSFVPTWIDEMVRRQG